MTTVTQVIFAIVALVLLAVAVRLALGIVELL